jgi:glycosyltransferase involved in cell wall biosynthesis
VHVLGRKPGIDLGTVPALMGWFRQHRPDVVHTHLYNADSYARLAAWLAGVPALFTTRHSTVPWPSAARRWIARSLSRVTNATIACGAEVERMLVTQEGIARERVRTVANGINLRRFESASGTRLRAELGVADTQVLIGVIGRLHPLKGHADLILALTQLYREGLDFQCIFVGGGDLHDALQRDVDEAGLNGVVRLLGQRSDMPDVLAAIDIFAMPSRREGLPMALLESMAMARAVLATAVGSIPEVITDGENGMLVEASNPSRLAEALARLLRDAPLRQRLGAAALATVKARYSSTQTAQAYEALYEQALSVRRSPR